MNAPVSKPSRWRRILLTFAMVAAIATVSLACCIYNVVTLSGEASILKKSVLQASGATVSSKIQISAGPLLLAVARLVVGQVKDVPPEALLALRSLRSASVGVYQLAYEGTSDSTAVEVSESMMRRRGWHPAIKVQDGKTRVWIYTPDKTWGRGVVSACVAVLEKNQLVVVSGEVEGRSLWPLIAHELPTRPSLTEPVERI